MGNRLRLILILLAIPLALIIVVNKFVVYCINPQKFSNWADDSLFYTISIILWALTLPIIYTLIGRLKRWNKVNLVIRIVVFSFVIALLHQVIANLIFYGIQYVDGKTVIDSSAINEFREVVISGLLTRFIESLVITTMFYFTTNNETQIRSFIFTHWPKLYKLLMGSKEVIHFINVKEKGTEVVLNVEEIKWFESAGNYIQVQCAEKKYLLRQTMGELYSNLDKEKFIRVHRSYIINLACIRNVEYLKNGVYKIILKDGKEIQSSKNYKEGISIKLKLKELPV